MSAVGRNELCPCGSGKKFKKCHEGRWPESTNKPLPEHGPRRREAFHEAGHAVASVLLDYPFTRVSLEQKAERVLSDGQPGVIAYTEGVTETEEQVVERRAERAAGMLDGRMLVVTMAGGAAEIISLGDAGSLKRHKEDIVQAMGLDMLKVQEVMATALTPLGDPVSDEHLARALCAAALKRADVLVQEHFPAVVRVAEALMARNVLSFDEVRALVEAAPPAAATGT